MKKNISINISGIIFHIEEDGYDKLKNYLESINRYFSTFDDSHEIIADIEGRIAEIFLSKLKDGRQVVSLDDVESLIATMGSVKDFQAAEEETDHVHEQKREEKEKPPFEAPPIPESRRLHRDGKRKILGGVLSGIAHYLNIDPLWIRLIYLLLFFGISVLESIGPILFIIYIGLWIIFPVSYELEEEEKLKKMYRDPDTKVLGGVCAGIAAYFGIDVIVIRLLFFISIFFVGTGVILYIILWFILPEAVTITDKMKMKGQPVTLSNIELNLKKSLNVKEGEENVFLKILLFPFRLIATLFDVLNKAVGPLMKFAVEAIRILVGAVLLLTGLAIIISAIVTAAVFMGALNLDYYHFYGIGEFPQFLLENELMWYHVAALLFVVAIPCVFLMILGLTTISRRKLLTPTIGWSLLGLWIVSLSVVGFKIPAVAQDFATEGYYSVQETHSSPNNILVLKIKDSGYEKYKSVDLNIKSSDTNEIKIDKEFKARGSDIFFAEENAQMVDYTVAQNDSVFIFDSNLTFKENARFRAQKLYVTMQIPEGQKFKVDPELNYLLGNFFRRKGFSSYQLHEKTWYFENEELKCEGCEEVESESEDRPSRRSRREERTGEDTSSFSSRDFPFEDFAEVDIRGDFQIKITQASDFSVSFKDSEENLDNIMVEKRGNTLNIRRDGTDFVASRDNTQIEILMPEIEELVMSGSSKATIYGFSNDKLRLETRETSRIDFDSNIDDVEVEALGSSSVTLFGKGDYLKIRTQNAAKVNSFDYYVDRASVEATGASEIKVYGEDRIEIRAEDGSKVSYRGNARVEIEKEDRARVEKE